MPALGLHHFNIHAPQAELAGIRDFYVEVLGLVEGFRPPFAGFGYWLYAGDQPVVHLSADEAAGVDRGPIDHVAFVCTDLDAMRGKLDSLGIQYSLSEVPGQGIRQVFFPDPLGNGIELSFFSRQP
jgi:glyoxylase I family protein